MALLSGVLMIVSLAFPVWRIILTAPQYAGRKLYVRLYAYPRITGDVREVSGLNKYVGFHFPDPVYLEPNYEVAETAYALPEWSIGPMFFVVLAIGAFAISLSSDATIARRLKLYFAGVIAAFVGLLAWAQVRLYQVGHNLDESAPMAGVEGFTPPVLGGYQIANISGNAWLDVGGYLLAVAVILLGTGVVFRDSEATIRELPEELPRVFKKGRDRIVNRIATRST
ncbi:hypothetical protein [Natronomonas sp. LN261]|uniref:hypothetical protein n=1 Tax=Natronomonas sp. LN261 TaxID=2750669 RepID=UPI0015EFC10A|nr:hypothetical protein [Natronomonas sp. LN261]